MKKQLAVMLFALVIVLGFSGAVSAQNSNNNCCPVKQICKPKCEVPTVNGFAKYNPIKQICKPKCEFPTAPPRNGVIVKPIKCFKPVPVFWKPRCCAPPTNGQDPV